MQTPGLTGEKDLVEINTDHLTDLFRSEEKLLGMQGGVEDHKS